MPWQDTPCVEWEGRRTDLGYGRRGGRLAHRVAYEEQVGPIPEGHDLDHLCENRACVNVLHLKPATRLEHLARHAAMRAHCRHGHPWSEANTHVVKTKQGWTVRYCRRCAVDASRRYQQSKKENKTL